MVFLRQRHKKLLLGVMGKGLITGWSLVVNVGSSKGEKKKKVSVLWDGTALGGAARPPWKSNEKKHLRCEPPRGNFQHEETHLKKSPWKEVGGDVQSGNGYRRGL